MTSRYLSSNFYFLIHIVVRVLFSVIRHCFTSSRSEVLSLNFDADLIFYMNRCVCGVDAVWELVIYITLQEKHLNLHWLV